MRKIIPSLAIGLFLVAAQIGMFLFFAPFEGTALKISLLTNWDGGWFRQILEKGYTFYAFTSEADTTQISAAFFPAYPLFARVIGSIFHLSSNSALVFSSILIALAFWTVLSEAMKKRSALSRWTSIVLIFSFPTAFYLIAAYSEGLFLLSMLIWIRYLLEREKKSVLLSSGFGILLGLTRIVAIPLSLVPIAHGIWSKLFDRKHPASVDLWILRGAMPLVGTAIFLTFCKFHYGSFFFPFEATRHGWWAKANIAVFWSRELWLPSGSLDWYSWDRAFFDIRAFNYFITSVIFWILLGVTGLVIFRSVRDDVKDSMAALYLICAWALFSLPAIANYDGQFLSMPRYLFPPFIFIVLALGQIKDSFARARVPLLLLQWIAIVAGFMVQIVLLRRFAAWEWVAKG